MRALAALMLLAVGELGPRSLVFALKKAQDHARRWAQKLQEDTVTWSSPHYKHTGTRDAPPYAAGARAKERMPGSEALVMSPSPAERGKSQA